MPAWRWMKRPASPTECPADPVASRPGGRLGLVRRLFTQPRRIGGDDTQWVHPSALCHYAPVNLAKYLNGPDARIYGE